MEGGEIRSGGCPGLTVFIVSGFDTERAIAASNRRSLYDSLWLQDSKKLYAREGEVEELLAVFDRTCEGAVAALLVAGYAGIGKTFLIQELYHPIVRE